MALLVFGSLAVAAMLLMHALEARSSRYVLGFALASAAAAAYVRDRSLAVRRDRNGLVARRDSTLATGAPSHLGMET